LFKYIKLFLGGFTEMKKAKLFGFSLIALGLSVSLAACGGGKGKTAESGGGKGDAAHSAVIITDTGGVDDKSFNQSSWEDLLGNDCNLGVKNMSCQKVQKGMHIFNRMMQLTIQQILTKRYQVNSTQSLVLATC